MSNKERRIIIEGGVSLQGRIKINGSKNAALPILAATILTNEDVIIDNVPHLRDISLMINLLAHFGVDICFEGHGSYIATRGKRLRVSCQGLNNTVAPYDLVNQMRASIVVLGPMLTKYGKAKVSLPGGCAIGLRPINFHLEALKQLGAEISIKNGDIVARAPEGLVGAEITFPRISVGATENIIMAAVLAKGKTLLHNIALEPEVINLVDSLNTLGAKIEIVGRTAKITGVKKLGGGHISVIPDRIEAGSYAVASLITKGDIELLGIGLDVLESIHEPLISLGAEITETKCGVRVRYLKNRKESVSLKTREYPGFPTDMQAQFCALLSLFGKDSVAEETIFENRFMHIAELNRMGANIDVEGNKLKIHPVESLSGAEVSATDLRASMALVLAGLAAGGITEIHNIHHIDRGYEALEENLVNCGANIQRQ